MKTVTKDTYLKSMLFILGNYRRHTVIYHSYLKGLRFINVKKSGVICMTKTICHTHKSKASTRSGANTKNGPQAIGV